MKNMRIMVTGGAGLIGSHIIDLLIEENVKEIIVLDNFIRGRRENLARATDRGPVTIVEGDIRNRNLLKDIMSSIDIVFHQAAIRITQCAEEPRLAQEVLVNGTFNVMESAVQAAVKKVITASTASVYGMADEFPTSECHPPYNNRTFYGLAKAYNEALLRSFHEMYGLDYLALRYFNVYGPRMDIYGAYTEVLIRWIERISVGKPPLIFGDGFQTMDFVYAGDVARANILAAKSDATDDVFNIASGVETSLNDLVNALLKVMESELLPEYGQERKVNPVPRRFADTSKAKHRLGFSASISLEEGLKRLVDWWRKERMTEG